MALNDIWSSFHPPNSNISKLYRIRPQKLKLLIRNQTSAFRWYECWWPWRYFKVIKLFHIKFLVNGALYSRSYYKVLIGNYALVFDWCHFWWPWSTFEGHFSLVCHFHVHLSNPWLAFASRGLPAIAELLVIQDIWVNREGLLWLRCRCFGWRTASWLRRAVTSTSSSPTKETWSSVRRASVTRATTLVALRTLQIDDSASPLYSPSSVRYHTVTSYTTY